MIIAKQNLLSSSKYNIKSPYSMDAEYITFHNTANDATAENEIKYMIGNTSQVSYHFAVDDKEVVQGVPTDRMAWHCGDGKGKGNMKSIGVEVCYSKSGGIKYSQAEELGIQFIAQLLFERNWTVDRVKPHQFWSGKNCPHRILDEKRWESVLGRINSALQKLIAIKIESEKPKPQIKEVSNKLENELSTSQDAIRLEAMALGITDGKHPLREVNQHYVWRALIPFVRKIQELEDQIKKLSDK